MTSINVNHPIPIIPPVVPPVGPVTELIDILANIVEIGGISAVSPKRVTKCETIVKRDFPNGITYFFDFDESVIQDLVKFYKSKRDSFEHIAFGFTATRHLKGLMHYVQDYRRRGVSVDTSNLTLEYVNQSLINAREQKILHDQKEVNVGITNPGKFTKKKY